MTQQINDEDLFAAALLLPGAERGGFLARACGDDAAALSRLANLLDTFDDAADFVRTAPLVSENAVEEIRSYRLLRELGEGDCGIAYLAEQLAPVSRQLAVKVIKPGMDTKAVVARFEAERQLLALMDHPNVARVFDAGSTAAGRPAVPPRYPDRVGIPRKLAEILVDRGRFAEARPLPVDALRNYEQEYGRNNWRVAEVLDSLSRVSSAQGRPEEAEDFARQALVVSYNVAGDRSISTAYHRTTLGMVLWRSARYREAERELRHALAVYSATTGFDDPYAAAAEYFLGEVLLATGRLAEAESVLTASMTRWKKGGFPSWRAARSASALGEALHRQGKVVEGARYMSESLRALAADAKADVDATNAAQARVARYLKDQPSHRDGENGVQVASEGRP